MTTTPILGHRRVLNIISWVLYCTHYTGLHSTLVQLYYKILWNMFTSILVGGAESCKCQVSCVTCDVCGWLCCCHGYWTCIAQFRIVHFSCEVVLATSTVSLTTSGILFDCHSIIGLLGYCFTVSSLCHCIHSDTDVITPSCGSGHIHTAGGRRSFQAEVSSFNDTVPYINWSMYTFHHLHI